MIKIPDYIFYRLYKNSSVTNKSIPEWSSIFIISIALSFNVISVLIFFGFDIELIGKKGFQLIPIIFIGINYFVFLYKKRYLNIINQFDQIENKLIYDILVLLYISGSILIFFYLAEMGIKYWIYIIALILIISQVPNFIKFMKK